MFPFSRLYFTSSIVKRFFQPVPLFTKLEADKIAEWKRRFGSDQPTTSSSNKPVADKKKTMEKTGKTDKKEKKAATKNGIYLLFLNLLQQSLRPFLEKPVKHEQPAKPAIDPAITAQLNEIRKQFNIKQVPTKHSEAANEANATADKLEKQLAEMQKYFHETLRMF